jgi:hypothetical protein
MKSKKLISFLCAAAMTTSAFAGLAVTASAATTGDIIWSDNFDAQNTGIFLNGTTGGNAATNDTAIPGLTFVTSNRDNGDKGIYQDENGDTVLGGSYYAVNEKTASDKYLRLSFPVFADYEDSSKGRWAYVDLPDTAVATDTKDLVMDFDVKLTKGLTHGETNTSYLPVLRIGSFASNAATAVKIDETATGGNDWTHARIVVSNSTGAKLYINGTEVESAANANVKSLDKIGLYSSDGVSCGNATVDLITYAYAPSSGTKGAATTGDSYADADKQTYTPLADLDNVVIYQETAGEATGTSTAPGAQTGEAGEKVEDTTTTNTSTIPAAPTLAAPDGVTGLQTYNFDSNAVKTWPLDTDSQTITDISGLTLNIGGRSSGGDASTYAAIKKTASGNALQLSACKYATAGRAPYLSFNTGLPVDLDTNTSTAISFAVRLSAAEGHESDATPRLFFLKDATKQGDDGNGAYRNVAAVLTTVEDETIYRGDDSSSDVISTYITPDEWHYVTLVVTPGDGKNTHRLYVDTDPTDTKAEPVVKVDYVATGENASSMDNLPILAVESKAAKVNGVDQSPSYGVATIDNILAYQGTVSEPRKLIATPGEAPEPEATPVPNHNVKITYDKDTATASVLAASTEESSFDGVLVVPAYRTDGTLESVKTYPLTGINKTTAVTQVLNPAATTGSKLMVWDSLKGMVPYGTLKVTEGAAQATAVPAPTAEPTDTPVPTATVAAGSDTQPSPTATVAAGSDTQPSPTATATVAPKYTVSGTADDGVATVTLTEKLADGATGTAATYSATLAAAGEGATGQTVTVANVPAGTYTVSATAKADYKDPVITSDTVTVTNADVASAFAITTTKKLVVSGTVDAGVKSVTLHPQGEDGHDGDKTGTISGETVTFDDVADSTTYTIDVALNDNYSTPVIKVAGADATTVTIAGTDVTTLAITTTDNALYRENVTALSSGAISTTVDAAADAANASVADYGSASTPIEALDGWGYKHFAYDGTAGRQSSATVDAAANAVFANGVGNSGCNGAVSFILGNVDDVTVPTKGKIVYTFDAIVTTTGGSQTGDLAFGFTSAADGTTVTDVVDSTNTTEQATAYAKTTVAASGVNDQAVTKKVVMTYSIENQTYSISVDGTQVKSGKTAAAPTGIYTQAVAKYIKTGIANLVVTVVDSDPTVTVSKVGNAEGEDATAPFEVAAGSTATVTTTKNAGRKVTVTAKDADDGDVAVTAGENGTYTFTMPAKAVTVTATFARADVATVTVDGPKTVAANTTKTFTATTKSADEATITADVVWSVVSADDNVETLNAGTTIDSSTGALTVANEETATKVLVKATAKASGEESENVVGSYEVAITHETVYTITAATGLTGGSVFTDIADSIANETITVTPVADPGYEIATVTYTDANDETQTITADGGKYTFTMPAAATTVSATFAKVDLAITNATAAAETAHGSITVAETAQVGDTVTVTVNAAEGYELDTLTVVPTDGTSATEVSVSGNTFTMPGEAVTVTATFMTEISKYVSFADGKGKAITVSSANADKTYAQLKKAEFAGDDNVVVADGVLIAKSAASNAGAFVSGNATTLTVVQIDASDIAATNKIALSLKATCTTSDKNSNVEIKKMSNIDLATATFTSVIAAATGSEVDLGNAGASGATLTYDATDDINAADGRKVTYLVWTKTARQQKISDLAINLTALYSSTVNVTDSAESPAALAGATVTIKNGSTTVATGETSSTGAFTANLEAGTYTVEVSKEGYKSVTDGSLTVSSDGTNTVTVALEEESDVTYSVVINTAPNATVKLNAGTSTAGTQVAEQTVTADATGVATLLAVPAGTEYTVDITPANKYLQGLTSDSLTVAADALTVDKPLSYKSTYANMIYGDDFSSYTEDAVVASKTSATNGVWNFSTSNAYSGLLIRGEKGTQNPGLLSKSTIDGNYLYAGMFDTADTTTTATMTDNIDKIAFDTIVDTCYGSKAANQGYVDTTFAVGGTTVFSTDGSAGTTAGITIKAGDKTLSSVYQQWVHVEISNITSGTATVTITKYASGNTALSEETDDTITATVTVPEESKTLSATNGSLANAIGSKSYSGFVFDNLEIYKAAVTE